MTLKSLNFTLLVVNLESEKLSVLADELNAKRVLAPDFFAQTPMVANVNDATLNIDFSKLQNTVERNGFFLVGMTGHISEQQKQQATKQSIAVLHSSKKQLSSKSNVEQELVTSKTDASLTIQTNEGVSLFNDVKPKVHIGRVRSGQQIYAKESDLVISGDVGAGAEVIADGNIHIYGALRGKALAGAMGNTNTAVFCQTMKPELVSIAGVYKLSETIPDQVWATSCSVFLEDQKLVFSNLNKI